MKKEFNYSKKVQELIILQPAEASARIQHVLS